jgi:hypothetical protein
MKFAVHGRSKGVRLILYCDLRRDYTPPIKAVKRFLLVEMLETQAFSSMGLLHKESKMWRKTPLLWEQSYPNYAFSRSPSAEEGRRDGVVLAENAKPPYRWSRSAALSFMRVASRL